MIALFLIYALALFLGRYSLFRKYLPSRTFTEARSRPVLTHKELSGMMIDSIQAIAILSELFHVFDMLITSTAIAIRIDFRGFLELNPNKLITNLVIGHT